MIPKQPGPGAVARAWAGDDLNIAERQFRSDTTRAQRRQCLPSRSIPPRPIDFERVNHAALARLPAILGRWLPGGRIEGREYVVRNPKRCDRRPGSFKINLDNGRWADWAVGDKGGDPISLAAYLAGCSQVEAAHRLAAMLGIAANGR